MTNTDSQMEQILDRIMKSCDSFALLGAEHKKKAEHYARLDNITRGTLVVLAPVATVLVTLETQRPSWLREEYATIAAIGITLLLSIIANVSGFFHWNANAEEEYAAHLDYSATNLKVSDALSQVILADLTGHERIEALIKIVNDIPTEMFRVHRQRVERLISDLNSRNNQNISASSTK